MINQKVLIITGPGGSGKSTLANLVAKRCGYFLVDGDELDTEFFPHGKQWLPENAENLKKSHNKIFSFVKDNFKNGRNIVVDYIIFGDYQNFFKKFKNEFGKNLEIKILFPSTQETIKRDRERSCWTTGVDRINAVRKELENIKNYIGDENFIDTTIQTPEETFEIYFKNKHLNKKS